jgi:hypothetical protein
VAKILYKFFANKFVSYTYAKKISLWVTSFAMRTLYFSKEQETKKNEKLKKSRLLLFFWFFFFFAPPLVPQTSFCVFSVYFL